MNNLAEIKNCRKFANGEAVSLGDWFWVKSSDPKEPDWIGCVSKTGSNFVEVRSPSTRNSGYSFRRVHIDDFYDVLRKETNPKEFFRSKVDETQLELSNLFEEVRKIQEALGLTSHIRLTEETSSALVVTSSQNDIPRYELELKKAKSEDLPALFEKIEQTHEELSKWMSAGALEVQAKIDPLKQSLQKIDEQLFTVSLYAGLTEHCYKVKDGLPAGISDKVHVMQRKLYMDEECLYDYEAGGMEFKHISAFDDWLIKPANFSRIFPFPKTVVAFQVRRKKKERDYSNTITDAYIRFELESADESTFFYIRNGERLYRICSDLEFPQFIFPNRADFDPGAGMMVKHQYGSVQQVISISEYDVLVEEYDRLMEKLELWKLENPGKNVHSSPYTEAIFASNPRYQYSIFDQSNVYFDDIFEHLQEKFKEYNRIAILLQGLLDRSEVFYPHHQVKTWDALSFAQNITLIYDAENTLYASSKPDFIAYQEKLNSQLQVGSVIVGQRQYWKRFEADKESGRLSRKTRDYVQRLVFYEPYGNPGPKKFEVIKELPKRSRRIVLHWTKVSDNWRTGKCTEKNCSLIVPESEYLNVSAYQAGDYRQFFEDPRTRQEYLQWAPMLLAAEDFVNGKSDHC